MIIFQSNPKINDHLDIILLFGTGLIGSSVFNTIIKRSNYISSYFPCSWENKDLQNNELDRIKKYISNLLTSSSSHKNTPSNIAFIWAAGKAGFTASDNEIKSELLNYERILDVVKHIMGRFPENTYFFHHISSAGGLFERQRFVNNESIPHPERPYGSLKLSQEKALLTLDGSLVINIYRPTSVYGYTASGQRMSLISTLISNGIQNKVSTIFGNLSTLRDYILNDNIGEYVEGIMFNQTASNSTSIHMLASGKPSSIFEIQHIIERLIGKKIYLNFHSTPETNNYSDITINSTSLPSGWVTTNINIGIRRVMEKIMNSKANATLIH